MPRKDEVEGIADGLDFNGLFLSISVEDERLGFSTKKIVIDL